MENPEEDLQTESLTYQEDSSQLTYDYQDFNEIYDC